jgi:curli biogenesis system outer membrane secretion channel CsgG
MIAEAEGNEQRFSPVMPSGIIGERSLRGIMRKLSLVCLLTIAFAAAVPAQPKRRIAVMNFDYATVQGNVSAIFGTNQDIGKGIADLLVDRFVGDHVFTVIERKALDKVLAEQNFSNSDRADASSAAKLGRILGVDAIVIGSITQFGRDDKSVGVGGRAFGGFGAKYGIGGVGKKEAKAVVGITARLINTDTAEILASVTGKGESQRSGTTMLGDGGGSAGGGGFIDMSSKNFGSTIIGEAVSLAVNDVSKQLEQNATSLPAKVLHINGVVADVSGGTLVVNVGSKAGLKAGDRLQVTRPIREIRDPSTGKVIRRIEDKLGEVELTDVDELSSVGKYTGATPPKVGDAVKNN